MRQLSKTYQLEMRYSYKQSLITCVCVGVFRVFRVCVVCYVCVYLYLRVVLCVRL